MQPTVMPAWKLTADSIWNSFRSSGKKHLLLTGSRRIGKSTLLKKLIPDGLPGVTTWVVPGEQVFLSENGTDHTAPIGVFDPLAEPHMKVLPEGFSGLGAAALRRAEAADSPWAAIDEIGFLERHCPAYINALSSLLDQKHVIAVVRKQNLPFLNDLLTREDAFVIDLDAPFGNTGCILMASGLGQRFGGNKLMADFCGEPMIARIIAATDFLPHRIVVTRHDDVAAYCRERSIPVILHAQPFRSDTVRLGLEALPDADRCFFCPCDQPLLTESTMMSLALLGTLFPDSILRPTVEGRFGAPVLFPMRFFSALLSLPEGKGGSFLLQQHSDAVRSFPIRNPSELVDVDTPADLAALEKLIEPPIHRPE